MRRRNILQDLAMTPVFALLCGEVDKQRAIRGWLPDKTVAWSTLFENGGWSRHGSYSLISKGSA